MIRLSETMPHTVSDTGCWEWTHCRNALGYGSLRVPGGKTWLAHRWAYQKWVGPIPDGLLIRHTCDNPPCINPEHLTPGTDADNVDDRQVRGRFVKGHVYRGETNVGSKVTNEQVVDIRTRYAAGGASQAALAREFGLTQSYVSEIILFKKRKDG